MCGILGVVRRGASIDLAAVERGRDLLAHRGPDGAALWARASDAGEAQVLFGHRRLSVLDLSARGDQPLLLDAAGAARASGEREESRPRLALTYNGEIYNFVELRDELQAAGHALSSNGDTEVLLRAYAQWGRECLARLNGMFAFALWDEARGELFCARDRFGEKPFYYVVDERAGVFAFASEVKALVGAGLARPELDERAVYRYFRYGEQAGAEQTIWRGVRRLMPAHWIVVRVAGDRLVVSQGRYWALPDGRDETRTDADATARFAELFADSVRLRLRSDVAVGTSLSGGLDSSSVVCQIHRLGAAAGQRAFTARMDDPALDEGRYAELVLRRTGIPGYAVTPTAELFLAELDRLFYHQEEPFPSTSIFASYLVQRLAREHGVVVMLDGQGADEYLAGYAHYPALVLVDLARRGRIGAWRGERAAVRARTGADPVPPRAALLHWLSARRGGAAQPPLDPEQPVPFLAADVRDTFAGEPPRGLPSDGDALSARLRADLTMGHLQELLRYADRNSMAFSRELRLPFLDHRLVEFTLGLPSALRYRRGESKWILRRAMQGVVPDEILGRRDKVGFATPWRRWTDGPVGDSLREHLRDAARSLSQLVEPSALDLASGAALGVMALASARRQLLDVAATAAVS